MTLDKLSAGQMATITEICGEGPFVQRLMALGLLEGAELSLTRKAIGGDPIEIEIPGTGAVEDVSQRFGAIFELFDLLKEMNQNMVNIDDGIKELNENIKELGLSGLDNDGIDG